MISVIVPVYNVEPYLVKCLDSIINQTFKDLEIIIIDDGSTDQCGSICDSYACSDSRIKVFHTENRGISSVRNLGIENARGEYVGFVDSDDWIEPDMYEILLNKAIETGADIVECGFIREFSEESREIKYKNKNMTVSEAITCLLNGELFNAVWNKLWKKNCIGNIRFSDSKVFEDILFTSRVFVNSNEVCSIDSVKYHYLQRNSSLSNKHNSDNLEKYWSSQKERYDFLLNSFDEKNNKLLLRNLAIAAGRLWAYYCDLSKEEKKSIEDVIDEALLFTKQNFRIFGEKEWALSQRIGIFFPHFRNRLSFRMAWLVNRISKRLKNERLVSDDK